MDEYSPAERGYSPNRKIIGITILPVINGFGVQLEIAGLPPYNSFGGNSRKTPAALSITLDNLLSYRAGVTIVVYHFSFTLHFGENNTLPRERGCVLSQLSSCASFER